MNWFALLVRGPFSRKNWHSAASSSHSAVFPEGPLPGLGTTVRQGSLAPPRLLQHAQDRNAANLLLAATTPRQTRAATHAKARV
eukprot:3486940-Pyramimonas_sp.AAC.1